MSSVADGSDGSASNSDVSGGACSAGSGGADGSSSTRGVDDPVEPEQPHPFGLPATTPPGSCWSPTSTIRIGSTMRVDSVSCEAE